MANVGQKSPVLHFPELRAIIYNIIYTILPDKNVRYYSIDITGHVTLARGELPACLRRSYVAYLKDKLAVSGI